MKNRHNPEKTQNNYGGDYQCPNYDSYSNGMQFCHCETSDWVRWAKTKDGNLLCKGNRHNCYKNKLKWIASLSEKEKRKLYE